MKKAILSIFLLIAVLSPVLTLAKVDIGWSKIGKRTGFDQVKDYNDVYKLANTVVNTVLSLLGIIFFGMMMYGGLRWMTAHGDDALAEKARNAIQAGIIGFIIVVLSYAITYFVFNKLIVTSNTSTNSANMGCCYSYTDTFLSGCIEEYTQIQCDNHSIYTEWKQGACNQKLCSQISN